MSHPNTSNLMIYVSLIFSASFLAETIPIVDQIQPCGFHIIEEDSEIIFYEYFPDNLKGVDFQDTDTSFEFLKNFTIYHVQFDGGEKEQAQNFNKIKNALNSPDFSEKDLNSFDFNKLIKTKSTLPGTFTILLKPGVRVFEHQPLPYPYQMSKNFKLIISGHKYKNKNITIERIVFSKVTESENFKTFLTVDKNSEKWKLLNKMKGNDGWNFFNWVILFFALWFVISGIFSLA